MFLWGVLYTAFGIFNPGDPVYWILGGVFYAIGVAGFVTDHKKKALKARQEVPPARQVQQLGEQYGLPVITSLQKKAELPPVAIAPGVTATQALDRAGRNIAETRRLLDADTAPVNQQDYDARVLEELRLLRAARNPGPSPEAQAELSADLLAHLRLQVAWDSPVPRDGHWVMSEEWKAEVLKLRDKNGPLWQPDAVPENGRTYLLLGHDVGGVGPEYGVPEIVPAPVRKIEPGYTAIVKPRRKPAAAPTRPSARQAFANPAKIAALKERRAEIWAEAQASRDRFIYIKKMAEVDILDREIRILERMTEEEDT